MSIIASVMRDVVDEQEAADFFVKLRDESAFLEAFAALGSHHITTLFLQRKYPANMGKNQALRAEKVLYPVEIRLVLRLRCAGFPSLRWKEG